MRDNIIHFCYIFKLHGEVNLPKGIKKDRFHDFLKNFEAKLNKNGHLNGRRIYGRGIPPLYDFLFISDFVLQDTKNIFCQNYQASMVKMFIF